MGCADGFLEQLLDEGHRPAPSVDAQRPRERGVFQSWNTLTQETLAQSILEQLPGLRQGYDSWWEHEEAALNSAFRTAEFGRFHQMNR